MKLWFAPSSDVPLYRQLCTQVQLAILSGDLKPAEKLPSTRALARRFDIHPNTVSSAYKQLEEEGWVESRRGSGVYVTEQKRQNLSPEQILDVHIAGFFRAVRELGLSEDVVKSQVNRWLAAPPPDHFVLIEADPKLAQIFSAELNALTTMPVQVVSPMICKADRKCLAGAVPLCRPSRRQEAQEAVGVGVELHVLPINSAVARLAPLANSAPGRLIAIASHWPPFVEIARTMLVAAGVAGDELLSVDMNAPDWERGLESVSALVCDVYTDASASMLPKRPKRFVFPLLAETTRELLLPFERATSLTDTVQSPL